MKMKRRTVIHKTRLPGKAERYELELECGHKVIRRKSGSGVPNATRCEQCAIVLDRLEMVPDRGFAEASKIGTTYANLKFLENEGWVKSSPAIRGNTIYWARSSQERN